jgi:putative hydrolase of the HAD superfamily
VTPRAVVFDLWQTLARWPEDEARELRRRWSESIGVTVERLDERWYSSEVYERRESGPIRDAIAVLYQELGCDADVEEVLEWRLDVTRRALQPDEQTLEALAELRRLRIPVGLISNCTEDVALVWHDSPLAGLIDVPVFSATAGLLKPDRRIYELACTQLGVEASACLFVGDGANDELRGAERVGMTPVLVHPPDEPPVWDGLESWSGLRITAIPQVLDLLA